MPSGTSSSDEHAIAVGEEAITTLYGMTVSGEGVFSPGKRAHQHQERRLRQMEIGEHRLDYFEAAARREKDVGRAAMGLQAADAGTVFQYSDRSSSSGHHAPPFDAAPD